MAKYGKKTVISEDLCDYLLMIGGLTGTGKTTTITEVAEKLYGEDGYLLLDTGDEEGVECIEGINAESCETYKKYTEVCSDIVKNRDDYPELKVVIIDTLDSLLKVTEAQAISDWNKKNMGKQGFVPAKSKNAIEGGFDAPFEIVFDMIYKYIRALKKVGVGVWFTAHQKNKDLTDPYTERTYRVITSKMANRYFDDFVTKLHAVGMIVEDRSIEAEDTGKKAFKGGNVKVNRIKNATRKIIFRDPNVNSKSRFADIVDEIPLDADEFIKAIKDAIAAEKAKKAGKKITKVVEQKKDQEIEDLDLEDEIQEMSDSLPEEFEEEVIEDDGIDYEKEVATLFKALPKGSELKKEVTKIIKQYGKLTDCPKSVQKELYEKLK